METGCTDGTSSGEFTCLENNFLIVWNMDHHGVHYRSYIGFVDTKL